MAEQNENIIDGDKSLTSLGIGELWIPPTSLGPAVDNLKRLGFNDAAVDQFLLDPNSKSILSKCKKCWLSPGHNDNFKSGGGYHEVHKKRLRSKTTSLDFKPIYNCGFVADDVAVTDGFVDNLKQLTSFYRMKSTGEIDVRQIETKVRKNLKFDENTYILNLPTLVSRALRKKPASFFAKIITSKVGCVQSQVLSGLYSAFMSSNLALLTNILFDRADYSLWTCQLLDLVMQYGDLVKEEQKFVCYDPTKRQHVEVILAFRTVKILSGIFKILIRDGSKLVWANYTRGHFRHLANFGSESLTIIDNEACHVTSGDFALALEQPYPSGEVVLLTKEPITGSTDRNMCYKLSVNVTYSKSVIAGVQTSVKKIFINANIDSARPFSSTVQMVRPSKFIFDGLPLLHKIVSSSDGLKYECNKGIIRSKCTCRLNILESDPFVLPSHAWNVLRDWDGIGAIRVKTFAHSLVTRCQEMESYNDWGHQNLGLIVKRLKANILKDDLELKVYVANDEDQYFVDSEKYRAMQPTTNVLAGISLEHENRLLRDQVSTSLKWMYGFARADCFSDEINTLLQRVNDNKDTIKRNIKDINEQSSYLTVDETKANCDLRSKLVIVDAYELDIASLKIKLRESEKTLESVRQISINKDTCSKKVISDLTSTNDMLRAELAQSRSENLKSVAENLELDEALQDKLSTSKTIRKLVNQSTKMLYKKEVEMLSKLSDFETQVASLEDTVEQGEILKADNLRLNDTISHLTSVDQIKLKERNIVIQNLEQKVVNCRHDIKGLKLKLDEKRDCHSCRSLRTEKSCLDTKVILLTSEIDNLKSEIRDLKMEVRLHTGANQPTSDNKTKKNKKKKIFTVSESSKSTAERFLKH